MLSSTFRPVSLHATAAAVGRPRLDDSGEMVDVLEAYDHALVASLRIAPKRRTPWMRGRYRQRPWG